MGGGLSMQLGMSGDATMALLGPLMLRGLVERLLAPSPTMPNETQLRAILDRLVSLGINVGSLDPRLAGVAMTAADVKALIDEIRQLRGVMEKDIKTRMGEDTTKPKSTTVLPGRSPEVARAREVVRRLVADRAARQEGQTASDLERARAAVRRLVAEQSYKDAARKAALRIATADGAR
jgi:hypothetical protein